MKNITLVTGGTGFIGSHLVEALVRDGRKVRCLVRKTSDTIYLKSLGAELIYGDLLDKESLKKAVKNVNVVYHLAARVRPFRIIHITQKLPYIYHKINLIGTMNLVEACFIEKVKKFIYYSSIAAAGPGIDLMENSPCRPITDYGKSKLAAERFLLNFLRDKKFPVIIVRPGQIYGPRNMPMLLLFKFIKKGIFPTLGRGDNSISFCYVGNLIKGTLLVEQKGKLGEIYFLVDNSCTLSKFAQAIAKTMDVRLSRLSLPKDVAYAAAYLKQIIEKVFHFRVYPFCMDLGIATVISATTNWTYSNKKAKEELGYVPEIDLEKGINLTVKWYRDNGFL